MLINKMVHGGKNGGNADIFAVLFDFGSESGSVTVSTDTLLAMEYSFDGNTWEDAEAGTPFSGKKIYVRAKESGASLFSSDSSSNAWAISGKCTISGNIMALLGQSEEIGEYAFDCLFYNASAIEDAGGLILPATTLASYCYHYMFCGCTSLTAAPELPATTMEEGCYYCMFYNCTSLTAAPELPATTMEEGCYRSMFNGCTSLTAAPELPATTLATYCYYYMFQDCKTLTAAPELPATTLVGSCYRHMFQNCTNLNYIKTYATDISASSCLAFWVDGVASSGDFYCPAGMESKYTTNSTSGIPSGWTVHTF